LEAKIYVIPYTLPLTGRYLWYTTYLVVESVHTCLTVFLDLNDGGFRRKFANISFVSLDRIAFGLYATILNVCARVL